MKKRCLTSLFAALLATQTFAQQTPGTTHWPYYDEVIPGKWTMNYEGAMAASKENGRDVLVYFTGETWCPDCGRLYNNVLGKPLWQAATADTYLVLLDFERRNGGFDAFLYDEDYLAFAGISTNEAFDTMVRNYELQNEYELEHVKRGRANNITYYSNISSNGVVVGVATNDAIAVRYGLPGTYKTLWYPTVVVLKGAVGEDPQFVGSFRDAELGISGSNPLVPGSDAMAVGLLNDWLGRSYFGFASPENNSFELFTGVSSGAVLPVINNTGKTLGAKVVSGKLPAGLKIFVGSGFVLLSGAPTKVGSATVGIQLSVSEKIGSKTVTTAGPTLEVTLDVKPFTVVNPSLAGTYSGWLADTAENNAVAGLLTATVSNNGKISLKLNVEGANLSYSGVWNKAQGGAFLLSGSIQKGAAVVDLSFDGNKISGTVTTAAGKEYGVSGERNNWKASPPAKYTGYYTLAIPPNPGATETPAGAFSNIPSGYGYMTFTVAANGGVKYAGKLADGTSVSGSAPLIEDAAGGETAGVLPVYRVLYSKAGAFGAQVLVRPVEPVRDNTVSLTNTVWRYGGKKALSFQDAFTMREMDLENVGGWYDKNVNLAAAFENCLFVVPNPGVAWKSGAEIFPLDDDLLPFLGFTVSGTSVKLNPNDVKATFSVNKGTGIMKGKFNLVFGDPPKKTVSASWSGVLNPQGGGGGYYLLPDNTLAKPFDSLKQSFPVAVGVIVVP